MKSIVLYTDGSLKKFPENRDKIFPISWGIVAIHDGELQEVSDSKSVKIEYKNLFEIIAFLEGLRLALRLDYKFTEMSFFTDCERVAYAQTWLHPENYAISRRDVFLNSLKDACKIMEYEEGFYEVALECLMHSRFIKLKGHRQCVYNNRADYLARDAMNKILKVEKAFEVFENWLSKGFKFWLNPDECKTYFPPFVQ